MLQRCSAGWIMCGTARTIRPRSAVLAARWPGVPNVGDITAVTARARVSLAGWADLPRVDVVCAGYPCQGESDAGLRGGEDDPRFRWPDVRAAVRALRPGLVVLENVRGHLGRSFPRVVADLSTDGYVCRWCCVRAADVGAPHRRERLFAVAWPEEEEPAWLPGTDAVGLADNLTVLPTPVSSLGRTAGASSVAATLDRIRAGHTFGLDDAITLLPTPLATDGAKGGPNQRGSSGDFALPAAVQPGRWGAYAPAIARWERVIGRSAPDPTIMGRNRGQLSPMFVEWMMGLSGGHVTDAVSQRSDALRVLGNGVVPQAAALALRVLLTEPAVLDYVQPDLFDMSH